jgi:hypothetical protein
VRAAGSSSTDDGQAQEGASRPSAAGSVKAELFNIAEDPYEKHDLASSKPEKVAELRGRYDAFAVEARPPRSAPKAPGFRSPRVWGEPD